MTQPSDTAASVSPIRWVAKQAKLYEESGGTKGTTVQGAPCLLLDYQGRRSGDWHRTVLIYGRDADTHLVVASNGGGNEHPQWYQGIAVNPDVRLRVGTRRFTARAETLSGYDKARVWPHLVEVFALYQQYRQQTSRDIPVIRLRPTGLLVGLQVI